MQTDLFAQDLPRKIVLQLKEIPPSFKNSKMLITKNPKGIPLDRPMLITKPEFQVQMEQITQLFASQLKSALAHGTGKTLTGFSLLSAIALSVPEDDCLAYLRGGVNVLPVKVESLAEEGVTITIERVS